MVADPAGGPTAQAVGGAQRGRYRLCCGREWHRGGAGGGRMTDRPPRGTNPGKPSRIDTTTAHSARIYNYWLGGKDNFPADREAAQAGMAANPGIVADVRGNRAYLDRGVP